MGNLQDVVEFQTRICKFEVQISTVEGYMVNFELITLLSQRSHRFVVRIKCIKGEQLKVFWVPLRRTEAMNDMKTEEE